LVLVRLARLGRTARAIAGGELGQRGVVDGNDMITTVAAEFNNMAASVSRLINEVRDQEAQLRSVLNSVDDGLVVLDDDYRVVAANNSFCTIRCPTRDARRRCSEAVQCMPMADGTALTPDRTVHGERRGATCGVRSVRRSGHRGRGGSPLFPVFDDNGRSCRWSRSGATSANG
jgi:PAS domain-containing protein